MRERNGNTGHKTATCEISGKQVARSRLIDIDAIRPNLADRIRADHPDLSSGALISRDVVERYRTIYVQDLLRAETGDLNELERQVADSLATNATLAENVESSFDKERTFGEKLSDIIASFGGSWAFLISFAAFLAAWMLVSRLQGSSSFDPYPFILLNLVLSTLAAVQAPVIMMSQKRQEAKDRARSLNDYKVNLKAELEIRHLHEKIDHLLSKQWQRLTEIQQLQLDLLGDRKT